MNKSMYSLILMDDLVKAVDQLAYERHTSRSALINHILAEHLSVVTPQMRISEIFEHVARTAEHYRNLQIQQQPSATMLVIKSVIRFKYNPTVRYSVEINTEGGIYTGEFRVVSRSQSEALVTRLSIFYEMWAQIEHMALSKVLPDFKLKFSMDGGRFRRSLVMQRRDELEDTRIVGEAIGNYVGVFDDVMNLYFTGQGGGEMELFTAMQDMYQSYLDRSHIVI